ncbi:MAG: hypothetical protein AAF065_15080 [Verrucomicrobiota bacterium]
MKSRLSLFAILSIATVLTVFYISRTKNSNDISAEPESVLIGSGSSNLTSHSGKSEILNLSPEEATLIEFVRNGASGLTPEQIIFEIEKQIRIEALEPTSFEALQQIKDLAASGGENNIDALSRHLSHIDAEHLPEAIEILNEFETTGRQIRKVLSGRFRIISQADPTYAMELTNALKNKALKKEAQKTVMIEWANNDPFATIDFINQNEYIEFHAITDISSHLFNRMARQDLTAAREFVEGTADPDIAKKGALGVLQAMVTYAEASPNELASYIVSRPREEQSQLIGRSFYTTEFANFEDGADFLQQFISAEDSLADKIYGHGLTKLANEYPLESADLASSINDPKIKSNALRTVMNQWVGYDMLEAAEWLSTAPAEPEYDDAIKLFVQNAAQSDLVGALDWAQSITDDRKREQTMTNLWKRLEANDPEVAQSFLKSNKEFQQFITQ